MSLQEVQSGEGLFAAGGGWSHLKGGNPPTPTPQASLRIPNLDIAKDECMPRPRTPEAKAKLTGADRKHPDRFRNRSEPKQSGKPVGKPPAYMSKECKGAWQDFVSELGWLQWEDRGALENAALCRGQIREIAMAGDPIPASMLAAMNTAIGKLGASPTDRSKVFQPKDDDEDDPFAKFGVQ